MISTPLRNQDRFASGMALALLALCAVVPAGAQVPASARAPAAASAPSLGTAAGGAAAAATRSPDAAAGARGDLRPTVRFGADDTGGGHVQTAAALRALLPEAGFPQPAIEDGTAHLPPLMLGGLSPDHTAVLVNGHRRHSTALLNVNGTLGRGAVTSGLNALPLAALGGIEVVRGDPGARVASGAAAGSVNLRLHEELGRSFRATYGQTASGDGETMQAVLRAGAVLGREGVVHVTGVWRDAEPTDRATPDTRQQYFGRTAAGDPTPISGAFGSGTGAPPAGTAFDPREATADRTAQRYGEPGGRELAAAVNARLPLAAAGEIYGFGDFSVRRGESALFFRRPGDARVVRALWPDGFEPLLETRVHDWSAVGGWRGTTGGGWSYDLAASGGANTVAYDVKNTNNASLGAAGGTAFYSGKLGYAEAAASLEVGRAVPLGFAQPARIGVGADVRRETFWIKAGAADSWRDGGAAVADGPEAGRDAAQGAQGFPGFRPVDESDTDRGVAAAHATVAQAVNGRLFLELSGRYERTEDAGETVSGGAGARLDLFGGLAVRGAAGTTFRQPHLAQARFSSTATNFIGGLPFENRTFPAGDPIGRALGATDLKPEKADRISAGVIWKPGANFGFEADVYRVDLDDRLFLTSNFLGSAVATFLESRGVSGATGGRFFSNDAATRTDGLDAAVHGTFAPAAGNRLALRAAYHVHRTRLTRVGTTPAGLAALGVTTPLFDLTEEIRLTRGQPRDNLFLSAAWDVGRWRTTLRVSRYGETEAVALTNVTQAQIDALAPGYRLRAVTRELRQEPAGAAGAPQIGLPTTVTDVVQTFDAKWVTDLEVSCRLTDTIRWSVGATNLFDVYPTKNVASRIGPGGIAVAGNDNGGTTPYNAISPFGFAGAFIYTTVDVRF